MKTFCSLLAVICLAIGLSMNVSAQVVFYDQPSGTLKVFPPAPPNPAPGTKKSKKPYWKYYWEFGDGQFATTDRPEIKHCYAQAGQTYEVRVRLIPVYSLDKPRADVKNIYLDQLPCDQPVVSRQLSPYEYINIASSTEELIAQDTLDIALTFKHPNAGSDREGYLVFLYNKKEDEKRLHFYPLNFVDRSERQSGFTAIDQGIAFPSSLRSIPYLTENIQLYADKKVYRCSKLPGNTEMSQFLSLTASASFDTAFINREKKENAFTTEIKAIWVPADQPLMQDKMSSTYELKLEFARDPNKIKVISPKGPIVYDSEATEIVYKVFFQNEGASAAKHVDIELAFDQLRNLNPASLRLLDWHNKAEFPQFFANAQRTFSLYDTTSCVYLDTSLVQSNGKVVIRFRNLQLPGKDDPNVKNKATKGWITFLVKGTKYKADHHRLGANIVFHGGGGDELETNAVKKSWRHHAWSGTLGANFAPGIDGFEPSMDLWQGLNVGVTYRNTALKSGLGWGVAANVANANVTSVSGNSALFTEDPNGNLIYNAVQIQQEELFQSNLDLTVQGNFRQWGIVEVGAGLGPSIPLIGRGTLSGKIISNEELRANEYGEVIDNPEEMVPAFAEELFELDALYEDLAEETRYGLLNQKEEVDFLGTDVTSKFNPGWTSHFYVEVGALDDVALGFQYAYRQYNNSYKQQCLKFSSYTVYLRFKILRR